LFLCWFRHFPAHFSAHFFSGFLAFWLSGFLAFSCSFFCVGSGVPGHGVAMMLDPHWSFSRLCAEAAEAMRVVENFILVYSHHGCRIQDVQVLEIALFAFLSFLGLVSFACVPCMPPLLPLACLSSRTSFPVPTASFAYI
jgi:hypothetical protein